MEVVLIVVLCVLAIAGANLLAPRLRIAAPLLLVMFGVAVSYFPEVPRISLNPEIILMGVLPPLLYAAAVAMPSMEFKRDFRAISGLSVVLVIVSALGLGVVFMLILPEADYATGVAIGAILSPTDAVATTTVKRVGAPNRLITVLSGESLFNDASALVLLRAAIAAMASSVSLWGVAISFVWTVVAAVAVGCVVGWVFVRVRAKIANPAVATAVSFMTPYVAFVPTELVEGSGLVAAVAAGLVAGRGAVRHLTAAHRLSDVQNWRMVEFLLEGSVFLLMGLELKNLVFDVHESGETIWHAAWPAAVGFVLLLLIRLVFVIPLVHWTERRAQRVIAREDQLARLQSDLAGSEHLNRRRARMVRNRIDRRLADIAYYRTESIGTREGFVVVWAGMRGVVTLAAAQTLPSDTPYRSMLVLLAFFVAVGSLLIQGGTLGAFVRWMRLPDHTTQEAGQRRAIGRELAAVTGRVMREPDACGADPTLARSIETVRRLEAADGDEELADGDETRLDRRMDAAKQMRRVRRLIVVEQRRRLLELRESGAYSSSALTAALDRLDAEELSLDAQVSPPASS
ncbi:cation:proton antiporter [Gordonia sp. HY002]|uniref:cation:proton antiporter n=1 Tax=Gordonia zhenghanii TaxID=2911516 RepID=UPI001EF1463F|nr:cation:proton antiporter [Gordonia zhenghanii]MCF8570298.1 cation:proton antiporter [Gordonia zhenghanii]MCF8605557.1 cation:proton antiporter [Gordonia zhenghanii]